MKKVFAFVGMMLLCVAAAPSHPASPEDVHPGDALRARLKSSLPTSDHMLIFYGQSSHHLTEQWSIVAWKRADGRWRVDRAGLTTSGLVQVQPQIEPVVHTLLSVSQGTRLDSLIATNAVYRETVRDGETSIGGTAWRMEIVTPTRHRTVEWAGRLRGKLATIADLILGRA